MKNKAAGPVIIDSIAFNPEENPIPVHPETINESPVFITPEISEPKKKGRPKGVKNKPKDESPDNWTDEKVKEAPKPKETKPKKQASLFDQLAAKGKEYQDSQPDPLQSPEIIAANASLVNGYLLLVICDALFPVILVPISKKLGEAKTRKDLKLDKAERESLEPLADAAAKEIFGTMSPMSQFLLGVSSVYLSKIV